MSDMSFAGVDVIVPVYGDSIRDVYDVRIDESERFLEIMSPHCRQIVFSVEESGRVSIVWDSDIHHGASLVIETLQSPQPMAFMNSRLLQFASLTDAQHMAGDFYPAGSDGAAGVPTLLGYLPCVVCGHNRSPRCVFDKHTSSAALIGTLQMEGGLNPYQYLGVVLYDVGSQQIRRMHKCFSDRTNGYDMFVIHALKASRSRKVLGVSHIVEWHDFMPIDWKYGHSEAYEPINGDGCGGLAVAQFGDDKVVIMPSDSFHGIVSDPTLYSNIMDRSSGVRLSGFPDFNHDGDYDYRQFTFGRAFNCSAANALVCWRNDYGISLFDASKVISDNSLELIGRTLFPRSILGAVGLRDWLILIESAEQGIRIRSLDIRGLVTDSQIETKSQQAKQVPSVNEQHAVARGQQGEWQIAIAPKRIPGVWSAGWALDVHTLNSVPLGDDGFGREAFETTRTEMGEALYQLKYRCDRTRLQGITVTMAEFIRGRPELGDVRAIIAVPPSCTTRRWQPVMALAASIGKLLNLPAPADFVVKIKQTPPLKDICDSRTRHEELKDAFQAVDERYAGTHVLLIDDLFRSGETLNSVANVLLSQGKVGKISVVTATMTRSRR